MACLAQFRAVRGWTAEEIKQLTDHCYRGKVVKDGHFLYLGKDGPDYGKTQFTICDVKYAFRRHQLSLFLKLNAAGFDMDDWKDTDEASHLCHKRRCYNPEHLVLEDRGKNKERDSCVAEGQCRGHGDSPKCLL